MQRHQHKKKRVLTAVQTRIESDLIERIDQERQVKGGCSRAVILRMALLDRYRAPATTEVA